MVILAQLNSKLRRLTTTQPMKQKMKLLKRRKRKFLCLVPVRFVSVKGLSSITPRFMRYGRSKKLVMKRLLSTITQKRYQRTSIPPIDLYFEPLFFEDVMNVIEQEKPIGVIVQFGGQTAINLAAPLAKAGVTHSRFRSGKY